MKFGHTTASLLIAKLHASNRHSRLAKVRHEYGRLIRTIFVAISLTKSCVGWYGDSSTRARTRTRYAATVPRPPGPVRRRLDDRSTKRSARPWSPTPPYSGPPPTSATLDARRDDGVEWPDELAAHLTPAQHDHIKCCGTSSFDVDHAHHCLILKRSRESRFAPLLSRPRTGPLTRGV